MEASVGLRHVLSSRRWCNDFALLSLAMKMDALPVGTDLPTGVIGARLFRFRGRSTIRNAEIPRDTWMLPPLFRRESIDRSAGAHFNHCSCRRIFRQLRCLVLRWWLWWLRLLTIGRF